MIAKKVSPKKSANKAGRGRPRGFDVDGALAIAQNLFHQRGYDGVGVAELSKAIGITAPSLYSAFGSKRGLFEQVLARYVQEKGGWLPEALAAREDLAAAIAYLFERSAEVYTTELEGSGEALLRGCLVMDGTRNCGDAGACELAAGYRQGTRALIRDRIAQALSPGKTEEETVEHAAVLADYVFMVLMGMSAAARDGKSEGELKAIAAIAAAGFAASLDG